MKFKTPKLETTQVKSFDKVSHFDFEDISIQEILERKVKWKELFPEFIILFGMLKDQIILEGFRAEDFKAGECPMWGEGEKFSTLLCFESNNGNIDVWVELVENKWVMSLYALDAQFCTVEEDFKTIQDVMDAYTAYN